MLTIFYSAEGYPEKLRRIRYYDVETDKHLCFLTNNFLLPALTIAQLYKCRWQVELFFKWIKQHLRIKVFYGNRAGGGITSPVLSHHRTYGSVYCGSCHVLLSEPQYLSVFLSEHPALPRGFRPLLPALRPSCEAFAPDRNRKSVQPTDDKFSPSSEKISFRLSSRRRRTYVLASVRCSNLAYSFPVHGFHECAFAARIEGISQVYPTFRTSRT